MELCNDEMPINQCYFFPGTKAGKRKIQTRARRRRRSSGSQGETPLTTPRGAGRVDTAAGPLMRQDVKERSGVKERPTTIRTATRYLMKSRRCSVEEARIISQLAGHHTIIPTPGTISTALPCSQAGTTTLTGPRMVVATGIPPTSKASVVIKATGRMTEARTVGKADGQGAGEGLVVGGPEGHEQHQRKLRRILWGTNPIGRLLFVFFFYLVRGLIRKNYVHNKTVQNTVFFDKFNTYMFIIAYFFRLNMYRYGIAFAAFCNFRLDV